MGEEEKPKCDIDDLLCQMQTLGYLKGMENLIGTEKFQERYPEFKGLGDVVKEKMGEQRGTIKEMMEKCGISTGEFEREEPIKVKLETRIAEE